MKKILAILALATAGSAFAASVTIEGQDLDGKHGSASQTNASLTVKEAITSNLVGDVQFSNTKTDATQALSTRLEAGVTGSMPVGNVSLYTRVATGEKYNGTTNFGYYSVEPGVKVPFGATGFTGQLGYRFRDAFKDGNNDLTRTVRAGVSYDLTKKDTIGVRYDRVRGDLDQNVWAVNYTRGF